MVSGCYQMLMALVLSWTCCLHLTTTPLVSAASSSACSTLGTNLDLQEEAITDERFYLNTQHPASCNGTINSVYYCYYAPSDNMYATHMTLFAVYRRNLRDEFRIVSQTFTATQNHSETQSAGDCVNFTLGAPVSITAGDMFGTYILQDRSSGPLHIIGKQSDHHTSDNDRSDDRTNDRSDDRTNDRNDDVSSNNITNDDGYFLMTTRTSSLPMRIRRLRLMTSVVLHLYAEIVPDSSSAYMYVQTSTNLVTISNVMPHTTQHVQTTTTSTSLVPTIQNSTKNVDTKEKFLGTILVIVFSLILAVIVLSAGCVIFIVIWSKQKKKKSNDASVLLQNASFDNIGYVGSVDDNRDEEIVLSSVQYEVINSNELVHHSIARPRVTTGKQHRRAWGNNEYVRPQPAQAHSKPVTTNYWNTNLSPRLSETGLHDYDDVLSHHCPRPITSEHEPYDFDDKDHKSQSLYDYDDIIHSKRPKNHRSLGCSNQYNNIMPSQYSIASPLQMSLHEYDDIISHQHLRPKFEIGRYEYDSTNGLQNIERTSQEHTNTQGYDNNSYPYSLFEASNMSSEELLQKNKEANIYDDVTPYQVPANIESDIYFQLKAWGVLNIAHTDLKVVNHLGSGQFGSVEKGQWKRRGTRPIDVALKTLNTEEDLDNKLKFLQEAAIMGQFRHPNVIFLHGVAMRGVPVMLVVELVTKGDLQHLLVSMRSSPGKVRSSKNLLLKFSQQVALGMQYLSAKGFVHRDLAARNVLVSSDNTCKVADFGMSRDLANENYYVSQGRDKIPIKWTAPEAIHYKKYSTASDVWAYGCLLYEIWSVGHCLFKGYKNLDAVKLVDSGKRLAPPPGCPKIIYKLMILCWHPETSHRPCFRDIVLTLVGSEKMILTIPVKDSSTHSQAGVLGAPLKAGETMYTDLQKKYTS